MPDLVEQQPQTSEPYTLATRLLGDSLPAWEALIGFIHEQYVVDELFTQGKPQSNYHSELKFRRGGKTLITFYIREGHFIASIVLGKLEREKFEARQAEFSEGFRRIYAETPILHDGKWLGLNMRDASFVNDITRLLIIKRRPNRKQEW